MGKRKRIGLCIYADNASNAGIVNYLFSMVKALNTLSDSVKPHLIICHSPNASIDLIRKERYPFIEFRLFQGSIPTDIISRVINKVARIIFNRNIFLTKPITGRDFDYMFPFPLNQNFDSVPGKVFWLVDFNPYYFPNHLTQEQRQSYFDVVNYIVQTKEKVILSSYDILKDLKKFHPNYTCKVEILRFAAVLPKFDNSKATDVLNKFNIDAPYFMTPNQFWVHKNHIVLLKAAMILKSSGHKFKIIFTGSTNVESESNYFPSLLDFVEQNGLTNEIIFLGLVDRSDQLVLMKNSIALVQPSLFEGWSTLIEESKALNKHIVVSDIPIHREQIDFNCTFFDPENEYQLAEVLSSICQHGASVEYHDYDEDIKAYANRIIEIFK